MLQCLSKCSPCSSPVPTENAVLCPTKHQRLFSRRQQEGFEHCFVSVFGQRLVLKNKNILNTAVDDSVELIYTKINVSCRRRVNID